MMTELSNRKKQLKLAQEDLIRLEKITIDDKEWNDRFEYRNSIQKIFIKSWNKYNNNRSEELERFLEISSNFARALQLDIKFRKSRMKQVRPFEDECVRIKKIIDKLEMEKWVQHHPKCPDCGSKNTAFIFWGMGTANQEDDEAVKQKEIVLGNNCKNIPDAKWNCTECGITWGEREE